MWIPSHQCTFGFILPFITCLCWWLGIYEISCYLCYLLAFVFLWSIKSPTNTIDGILVQTVCLRFVSYSLWRSCDGTKLHIITFLYLSTAVSVVSWLELQRGRKLTAICQEFLTVTHENVNPYYSPQSSIMDRSPTPKGCHYIRTQLHLCKMSTERESWQWI